MRSSGYLAVALFAATALSAQQPYSGRAIDRFMAVVRADTLLPDSLRNLSFDAIDSLSGEWIDRLNDQGIALAVRTMRAVMRQLPESQCNRVLDESKGSLSSLELFPLIDSLLVDSMLEVYRLTMHTATSRHRPKAATLEEQQESFVWLAQRMPAADRERLVRIVQDPDPGDADGCWYGRLIMDHLIDMPPERLGPLFRAMTGAGPEAPSSKEPA